MTILAIDPGTSCGWSLLVDGKVFSGVKRFEVARDESPGMRWLRFDSWLREMNQLSIKSGGKIGVIYHERPHLRGGPATQILMGFVTQLQGFAASINAEIKGVHTTTLKKASTGHGQATKEAMLEAARQKWPEQYVQSDDQADALHLLDYAMAELGVK